MKTRYPFVTGLAIFIGVAALLALAWTGWRVFGDRSGFEAPVYELPSAVVAFSPSPTPAASPTPSAALPSPTPSPKNTPVVSSSTSVLLEVPFTIQAPDGQWVDPWNEGCEEAALLMVDAYLDGNREPSLPVAGTKADIKKMVDWQVGKFGSHKDLGADDMATIAREYLGYKSVRVEKDITLADIKKELQAGHPVIVPAAGQLLKNPNFKAPGPPYHVFVIKGFEGDSFITNENGTRLGRGYAYSSTILTAALHDHKDGTAATSQPAAYLILEK